MSNLQRNLRPVRTWAGFLLLVPILIAADTRPVNAQPRKAPPYTIEEVREFFTPVWSVVSLEYVDLFVADRNRAHPAGIQRLVTFLDETIELFPDPRALREELRRRKIRYYFCLSAKEVHLLGGMDAEGAAVLTERAVVTRWLPHEHELVHILVDIVARTNGRQTEPVLQEGLASALGGRRSLAPAALLHEGEVVLSRRQVQPDRLWTYRDFHFYAESGPSYAAAGRLVQFLLATRGMERFLTLYNLLSATDEVLAKRPEAAVMTQIHGVYGQPWRELRDEFQRWRKENPTRWITPAPQPSRLPDLIVGDNGRRMLLWRQDDASLVIQLDGQGRLPEANVTWGDALPPEYRSRLDERTGATDQRRFGLRISPESVAVYDFALDVALARDDEMSSQGRGMPGAITLRLDPKLLVQMPPLEDPLMRAAPSFQR